MHWYVELLSALHAFHIRGPSTKAEADDASRSGESTTQDSPLFWLVRVIQPKFSPSVGMLDFLGLASEHRVNLSELTVKSLALQSYPEKKRW